MRREHSGIRADMTILSAVKQPQQNAATVSRIVMAPTLV